MIQNNERPEISPEIIRTMFGFLVGENIDGKANIQTIGLTDKGIKQFNNSNQHT